MSEVCFIIQHAFVNDNKKALLSGSAFCQGVFYLYSKKNYEVIDWQQDTEDAKRNSQVSIL